MLYWYFWQCILRDGQRLQWAGNNQVENSYVLKDPWKNNKIHHLSLMKGRLAFLEMAQYQKSSNIYMPIVSKDS